MYHVSLRSASSTSSAFTQNRYDIYVKML